MHSTRDKSPDDDGSAAAFPFPTVFEYCAARTRARRRIDRGRRFSSHKIFVNDGDAYNAGHVIRRFKNADGRRADDERSAGSDRHGRPDELPVRDADALSGLGLLTRGQYETFLDRPSAAAKIGYLRRHAVGGGGAGRGRLADRLAAPLARPRGTWDDGDTAAAEDRALGWAGEPTILTTLRRPAAGGGGGGHLRGHLRGCKIVAKDDAAAWRSALMQCAVVVFDVSDGGADDADDAVLEARAAFCHVRDELSKCGDEQLARWRDDGTVRCFVLISTAMTWAEETRGGHGHGHGHGGEEEQEPETVDEATTDDVAAKNPLDRAPPPTGRYAAAFELEKSVLRANRTRTRHVFKGRVIGAGVTYGHEQRALRRLFDRAWLGDDDDDDYYYDYYDALARRPVPAVHVDELAEMVASVWRPAITATSSSVLDRCGYALAVERPSYEFADVVDAVRGQLCPRDRRRRRLRTPAGYALGDDPPHGRHGLAGHPMLGGDLDADHPALRDFAAAAGGRRALVPDARLLAREYADARGLRPWRLLVSGRPRRVALRVAERLARRYRVPLANVRGAVDGRADLLRDDRDRLRAAFADAWATAAAGRPTAADDEWTADESAAVVVDDGYGVLGENVDDDDDDDPTLMGGDVLAGIDREIRDVERALADLNCEREHLAAAADLGRPDDPVHLLPLIRETLSSCSCRNRGYVVDVYPLSVERMDVIFGGDVDYPSAVVMLSYDPHDPDEITTDSTAASNTDDDDDDESSRRRLSRGRTERDSESPKADNSDGSDRQDDCRKIDVDTNNDDGAEEESNEKNDCRHDDAARMKGVVNYFTDKRSKILRMKVPFGLIDEKEWNDSQYAWFTDSIIAQVGRPIFADDVYKTATDMKQTKTTERKTKNTKTRTTEKSRTVLKKLKAMREEWNNDILKAVERDKQLEFDKNVKIQNYVNSTILPNFLKEISPIGNQDVYSDSRIPEKTSNKTKLYTEHGRTRIKNVKKSY